MSKQEHYSKQQLNSKIKTLLKDLEYFIRRRAKLDLSQSDTKEAAALRKELMQLKKSYNELKADNEKKAKALSKLLGL